MADPGRLSSWPQRDRQLGRSLDQARYAVNRARESLRWNLRAKTHQQEARPDRAAIDTLEDLTTHVRAVGRYLLDTEGGDRAGLPPVLG